MTYGEHHIKCYEEVLVVRIKYNGTLGNNMWQYAVGRLYAERHGHALIADSIEMFPNTTHQVDGIKEIGNLKVCQEHVIEFDHCDGDILFDGFFQRYEYLRGNKQKLRDWFFQKYKSSINPSETDLVMTIRRGWNGYPVSMCPPIEFYLGIIKKLSPSIIYLCTDTFDDPYFHPLRMIENVVFYGGSTEEQFSLLTKAKKMVISPSTYSWWGAYLSDANEILYPWFGDLIPTEYGPNLFVDDESRYIRVDI